jgi:hypothetical protein
MEVLPGFAEVTSCIITSPSTSTGAWGFASCIITSPSPSTAAVSFRFFGIRGYPERLRLGRLTAEDEDGAADEDATRDETADEDAAGGYETGGHDAT